MDIVEELESAESVDDVLAGIAAARGQTPPTARELADWFPAAPSDAIRETTIRIATMAPHLAVSAQHRVIGGLSLVGLVQGGSDGLVACLPCYDGRSSVVVDLLGLSRDWIEIFRRHGAPQHPLAPLVDAWIRRPPAVPADTRPDPLVPVVHSVQEATERRAGRLLAFGGIVDARDPPPGQLPLLLAPEGPHVPLLDLCDAYGVPTMTRGRGAPLELAIYIGACILTPYDFRAKPACIVTTVRELRAFLFGSAWRPGPTGNRPGDWRRVRDAALHASRLWIPIPHPAGGAPDLWKAVVVRKIPPAHYHSDHLDREVIFEVRLPPGASDGPPIDRDVLTRLRRESGPRFRAYIAAHSVAWIPGRTRIPHHGGGPPRIWCGDQTRYPVLTASDRRRFAFGVGDKRNRTRHDIDAPWSNLPGSVIITRKASTADGRRGWIIVPKRAADAIQRWRERTTDDLRNPRR